jgi:2,5-dihydroxypyridine 5,6-dioxygenase
LRSKTRRRRYCTAEPGHQLDYVNASMRAAHELGASTFNVNLLPGVDAEAGAQGRGVGSSSLRDSPLALEALKTADLMISLFFLLFSKEQTEIQKSGTRILSVLDSPEVLARLFPSKDLRERVESAEGRLKTSHELRFTNHVGTDVTYKLGVYPVMTLYGYTDTPGRWDHWPSGFVLTGAGDSDVNGRVVMDRGDVIFPFTTFVRDPIDFTIRDGRIVSVKGGADADAVRNYIEGFNDPRAWAISHIGWGLNEKARWTGEGVGMFGVEARAFYGNVLFSTGPNVELGGNNDTHCHLDLPMRNCTLYLDEELILNDGEIVPKDMRVPGR